jgi:hypothetical protein
MAMLGRSKFPREFSENENPPIFLPPEIYAEAGERGKLMKVFNKLCKICPRDDTLDKLALRLKIDRNMEDA